MAKYKAPYANYRALQEKRIQAILEQNKPDGTPMFPDGLTPPEIAEWLVGYNSGNKPTPELIALVDEICTSLQQKGTIDKVEE